MIIKEPTTEECSLNTKVLEDDYDIGYAIWYPQMGGYVGKALAIFRKSENGHGCIDVYIWHNGEFPFTGEGDINPVKIHHCMAEQFITFGETLMKLEEMSKTIYGIGEINV